jgi:hypothetical protein
MQETESARNPDHDLLLQIKGLQESFMREMDQKVIQINKDNYNCTMAVKDLRTEHREDFCKLDKRIGAIEKMDAVYESCFNSIKENNIVKKGDLREVATDIKGQFTGVYDYIKTEDTETRDEIRRSIVTWVAITGITTGVVGAVIGIIIGLAVG